MNAITVLFGAKFFSREFLKGVHSYVCKILASGNGKQDQTGLDIRREYSQLAEKEVDYEEIDRKKCSKTESTKSDPCQIVKDCQKPSDEESSKYSDDQKLECSKPAPFDIVKAAPQAFECPSEKLDEEKKKDLYYRYHQNSYYDLYTYLRKDRTFTTNKEKKEGDSKTTESEK